MIWNKHRFQGDHERLAEAEVAAFNELLPVGTAVMVMPDPDFLPEPVSSTISGPAFVQGVDIFVPVEGQEKPVNIKRIREGRKP